MLHTNRAKPFSGKIKPVVSKNACASSLFEVVINPSSTSSEIFEVTINRISTRLEIFEVVQKFLDELKYDLWPLQIFSGRVERCAHTDSFFLSNDSNKHPSSLVFSFFSLLWIHPNQTFCPIAIPP